MMHKVSRAYTWYRNGLHEMFEHEETELLDVVNDHDEVIDSIHRGDMMSLRDTPGRYLRVMKCFCSDQMATSTYRVAPRTKRYSLAHSTIVLPAI